MPVAESRPLEIEEAREKLTPASHATFHELAIREEAEGHIVGRVATGQFVQLPGLGVEVIRSLSEGLSVEQVAERLEEAHDAEVDVAAFTAQLISLGFVSELDGQAVRGPPDKPVSFRSLRPSHVAWLFGWPTRSAVGLLVVVAVALLVWRPELIPTYSDFFWSKRTGLVIAGNTALYLLVLAIHEFMHLAAARSLGVPAHFGLGTRLHFLVAQTDVTALWSIPRRNRFRVYLAGIQSDLTIAAICILLLASGALGPVARHALSAVVLVSVVAVLAQLHIYMRTDLYFVALDLLQCGNLFDDGLTHLKWRLRHAKNWLLRRGTEEDDPLEALSDSERRKVALYAWLLLIGSAVALGSFAVYGLPILVETFIRASRSLTHGIASSDIITATDGAATLIVEGTLQILFLVTFVRKHRGWFARLVFRRR